MRSGYTTFRQQEQLFIREAPFVHLYSSPIEDGVLVENDEDRKVVMNMLALVSKELNLDVLAYAIMNNHIHLILKGDAIQGQAFFENLKKRLTRFLRAKGKARFLAKFCCGTTQIQSLKQLRNEIAYVIRNPFVVVSDVNLFSYPWCSGYLYFNRMLPVLQGIPGPKLSYRERRKVTHTSDGIIPASLAVADGMILPQSFVNYQLVETLFGDARQFLFWVLKNVEAQVEVALSCGELPNMSDDELFLTVCTLSRENYGKHSAKELTDVEKKELAVTMHNRYYASNAQIARLLGLQPSVVNTLYPLGAK